MVRHRGGTWRAITVFGDGCQVRDLLWIDDLCELYREAIGHMDRLAGRVYNIGGGPANALSVREVLRLLENLYGKSLDVSNGPWRPGDQRLFISDTRKITADLRWTPRTKAVDGIARLVEWVRHSTREFEDVVRTVGARAQSGPGVGVEGRR